MTRSGIPDSDSIVSIASLSSRLVSVFRLREFTMMRLKLLLPVRLVTSWFGDLIVATLVVL